MLHTAQQAREAVDEIMDKTGWTVNRVATKALVHRDAITKLMDKTIDNPRISTLDRIDKLLKLVRGIEYKPPVTASIEPDSISADEGGTFVVTLEGDKFTEDAPTVFRNSDGDIVGDNNFILEKGK